MLPKTTLEDIDVMIQSRERLNRLAQTPDVLATKRRMDERIKLLRRRFAQKPNELL